MNTPKHTANLDDGKTLVAQWETKGNDWIVLYRQVYPRLGERVGPFTVYGYSQYEGTRYVGGGDADSELVDGRWRTRTDMTDADAIAAMERPWNGNGKPGAGAAFVLKCDRPSLKRVV